MLLHFVQQHRCKSIMTHAVDPARLSFRESYENPYRAFPCDVDGLIVEVAPEILSALGRSFTWPHSQFHSKAAEALLQPQAQDSREQLLGEAYQSHWRVRHEHSARGGVAPVLRMLAITQFILPRAMIHAASNFRMGET
jgi:hypothetical protein